VKSAAAAVSYEQHDRATRKEEEAGRVNKARVKEGGKESGERWRPKRGTRRESVRLLRLYISHWTFKTYINIVAYS
jgi:hypothetical protein